MLKGTTLILAAGMPRSGSTWLYNAVRLLIENTPSMANQFSCGWIGDWEKIPKRKFMLIKVHEYNQQLVDDSSFVLYSYRDLRDAMASAYRKFGLEPSMEVADRFLDDDRMWTEVSSYVMHYETMLHAKEEIIKRLISVLKLNDSDPTKIITDIQLLHYDSPGEKDINHNMTNLFHKRHATTDGSHGLWKTMLDPKLVKQIEEKHKDWFVRYGYTIGE